MRRALRILLHSLTLFSFLLFASSIYFWIRSYFYCDSLMLFRVQRQWSQMWIDRSMITMRSGDVYQADSRRGSRRLLYLLNDSSYPRAFSSFHESYPLAKEGQLDLGIPAWTDSTHLGFAIEQVPVMEIVYNLPLGAAQPNLPPAYTIHAIYTPWWFWTALLAALPGVRAVRIWRSRARCEAGHCAGCGYDLRGTPDRCPECGMVPKKE
jgi:hypothetical protein